VSADSKALLQARWVVCMAIGCCTGLLAFLIDVFGAFLFSFKVAAAAPLGTGNETQVSGDASTPSVAATFGGALFSFVVSSMGLVAVAAALVIYVEPISGGSGIPDVKTYLQGVKVPRLLRTSTLACKSIGVMFSVAAGLMVGKEVGCHAP
jgi:chloride channel 7